MLGCSACVYVCAWHACSVCRGQKRGWGALDLEFQMAMSWVWCWWLNLGAPESAACVLFLFPSFCIFQGKCLCNNPSCPGTFWKPDWPWIQRDPHVLASQVLGLKVYPPLLASGVDCWVMSNSMSFDFCKLAVGIFVFVSLCRYASIQIMSYCIPCSRYGSTFTATQ